MSLHGKDKLQISTDNITLFIQSCQKAQECNCGALHEVWRDCWKISVGYLDWDTALKLFKKGQHSWLMFGLKQRLFTKHNCHDLH